MIEVTGLSGLVGLAILDAGVWIALSVAVGYGAHHLPARWIEQDRWLTRLRRFEADGYFWRRHLAIGRWKDHLPEAGSLFGGVSKRRLPPGGDLHSLAVETRRAELVHWTLLACAAVVVADSYRSRPGFGYDSRRRQEAWAGCQIGPSADCFGVWLCFPLIEGTP